MGGKRTLRASTRQANLAICLATFFLIVFGKCIHYAIWSIAPPTVGLIMLLAWLILDTDSPAANFAIWLGIGGFFAFYGVFLLGPEFASTRFVTSNSRARCSKLYL